MTIAVLQYALPHDKIPNTIKVLSYVDDIIIIVHDDNEVFQFAKFLVQYLASHVWTINPDKIQGPAKNIKFLGVQWISIGPSISEQVMDKLAMIMESTNKTEAQHLVGLFGYWRHHIPFLQLILQPIHSISRKAADFTWGDSQKTSILYGD